MSEVDKKKFISNGNILVGMDANPRIIRAWRNPGSFFWRGAGNTNSIGNKEITEYSKYSILSVIKNFRTIKHE